MLFVAIRADDFLHNYHLRISVTRAGKYPIILLISPEITGGFIVVLPVMAVKIERFLGWFFVTSDHPHQYDYLA